MPNTTSSAVTVLEKTTEFQKSLIELAEKIGDEAQKKRLYKAALKADKGANVAKAILGKSDERVIS